MLIQLHDFTPAELAERKPQVNKAIEKMAEDLLARPIAPDKPVKLAPPQVAAQPAQSESETALEAANLLKQEFKHG